MFIFFPFFNVFFLYIRIDVLANRACSLKFYTNMWLFRAIDIVKSFRELYPSFAICLQSY